MNTTAHTDVRDPDGIPHEIVGLTFLLTIALAAFCLVALATGRMTSALTLVLIPTIVIGLDRRARRNRVR